MRRQQGGGGAKLAIGIVVAAVAVVGGAVLFAMKDDLFPLEKPRRPAPPRKVERRVVPPPARKVEPVKPKPPEPAPRAAVPEDEDRALGVLKLAESAMKECDFARAASLYSRVGSMNVSKKTAFDARSGSVQSATFRDVLDDIKRNPAATGKLKIFILDDRRIEAALVSETADSYIVRKDKGITVPLPKAEVYRVEDVSEAKKKAKLLARFEKRKEELASRPQISPALRSYLTAEFAYRNRLIDEAYPALKEAYSHEENLRPVVLEYRAGKLLVHAIWYDSKDDSGSAKIYCNRILRDYPTTKRARDARELLARMDARAQKTTYRSTVRVIQREEQVPAKVEVSMISSNKEANAPAVAEGNRFFEDAMKEYVQGQPGKPQSNQHLKRSVELFDKAVEVYSKTLESDPGNTALENRLTDCQRYGYHARKMQTVSVF